MYSLYEKIEIFGLVILKMSMMYLASMLALITLMAIVTKISGDKSFFRKLINIFIYK